MTADRRERARRLLRRAFYSVRGRATVITVSVSAVILTLLFSLLLLLAREYMEGQVFRKSERTVDRIVSDVARGGDARVLATGRNETSLVQVVDPQGQVVAAGPGLRGRPALVGLEVTQGKLLINDNYCPEVLDRCVWLFGLRLRTSPWGPGMMVMAATPLPTQTTMVLLPVAISLFGAALLVLIAWWTWYMIGRVFVPVDQIREGMAAFSAEGLGHRVPVPQSGGEIQSLAETVNATLAQLEEARIRERRFVSEASHDLRNPIAGLQTQLEVALEEPDDFDWKPVVRSALRDVQRLNDIVADLLELSRVDSRAPAGVERVDLADLARREIVRRRSDIPIATRLEPGVTVRANKVRLSRVLNNLLNNAERHAESRIDMTVERDGDEAVLEVLDDGSGIPEETRERVFERFARLPESQTRDPHGTGLGLPIAREIAETYGGSLRIADSPRGARFVLRLPFDPPPPAS